MIQIKWYARGGQGGFTACRLMALAAIYHSGLYAQAFPSFGPERRGAPVYGFTRIDSRPVRDHSQIYDFDYGIVIDSTLLGTIDVMKGLKPGGTMYINTDRPAEELGLKGGRIVTFDADTLSLQILKAKIANTAMMALAAIDSQLADKNSMEKAIQELMPAPIVEKNLLVVERVSEEFAKKQVEVENKNE
jgi:pyruvate ferredoxin oxidoreductase gamma subunit